MNLVPIDTGGASTDLIGVGAPPSGELTSPGGDFASLMTGLMAGDTQIVPLIDIPPAEHLTDGELTSNGDETTEVDASILEFVGTPPAGLAIPPKHVDGAPISLSVVTGAAEPTESIESTEFEGEPVPVTAGTEATAPTGPQAAVIDPIDEPELATVHLISNAPNSQTSGTSAPAIGVAEGTRSARRPDTDPAPTDSMPRTQVSPPETGPVDAAAARVTAASQRSTPVVTADALDTPARQRPAEPTNTTVSTQQVTAPDTHVIQPDVELDLGGTTRPLETGRPVTAISQPAMVGIARRVEEAVAALASRPDPKIVTLQLDELDGIRLTVALRPDGLHLSSTGDAALTAEIERALATRGFEMASGRDGERHGSQEPAEDGWRPESAPTGRTRSTEQPGIRL